MAKLLRSFQVSPLLRLGRYPSFATLHSSSFRAAPEDLDRSKDGINADVNWDELGFNLVKTDYMYVMRSCQGGKFTSGELNPYGDIKLSPSSGVLNYGQGLLEGLKAYRKKVGNGFVLFRPEENALRMQRGAERMCMVSPSVQQFVHAVKQTVLANKRWVPPYGKGSLYIRPLLLGSGPILGLAPSPEYMFLVFAVPVGKYFKDRLPSVNLSVSDEIHRATPGGTGGVKTISNYGSGLKAQVEAKYRGFTDVLFLDSVNKKYVEEATTCNIFIVKGNIISTPATQGTILPGITRKSIIEIGRDHGYQVEEGLVSIDELIDADEVFCTGTAVSVTPVSTITYCGQRFQFKTGVETVSHRLYNTLTAIQMGDVEDTRGWRMEIDE
ncbi:Branched-chain amino acid aminotransferase II protein [Dioscorea alata]|uniref:Branched-chain amino acid aminotransferase II protein n=1 Tax=Dioscorea alata TaxID=55571 RepID=A0ACB7UVU0_DIOAL|nr:Branched-chain amino acid aminotransferase II protein [Dioscorea alata]